MEYYERLKLLREDKKLSQAELGEVLGISQATISNYERNMRKPSPGGVIKFAKFFKVSANYLLGLTNDPTPLAWNKRAEAIAESKGGSLWSFRESPKGNRNPLRRFFAYFLVRQESMGPARPERVQ